MFPNRFQTPRLILRPIEAGDVAAIFEGYAQDPAVSRFLTWRPHAGIADTEAFIASVLVSSSAGVHALLEREGGRLVGCLDLRREAPHRIGFGYVLARAWWGRGLMSEALSEVVAWSLRQEGVWRVGAVCDVENLAVGARDGEGWARARGDPAALAGAPGPGSGAPRLLSYARAR